MYIRDIRGRLSLDIDAVYGMKLRNCVDVLKGKMKVGQLCAEGHVVLDNILLDGVLADSVKVAIEGLQEGWYSANDPTLATLINVIREVEKKLGVKILKL